MAYDGHDDIDTQHDHDCEHRPSDKRRDTREYAGRVFLTFQIGRPSQVRVQSVIAGEEQRRHL